MARRDAISWMWPEACAAVARAERLHCQFFHVGEAEERQPVWEPPVDVLETRGQVLVLVALPGVDPETVGAATWPRAPAAVTSAADLADLAAAHLDLKPEEKQEILETIDL